MSFVPLKVHSEFSYKSSIVRIDDLLNHCVENSIPAVAITDTMNLFGAIKFYQKALKKNIKPIIGVEILLENNTYATLLCKNQQGYENVLQIITNAYAHMDDVARVSFKDLKEFAFGNILLLGGKDSELQEALTKDEEKLYGVLTKYQDIFANDLYVVLEEIKSANDILAACGKLNIACAYANPVYFLNPEDYEARNARVCIHEGKMLCNMPSDSLQKSFYLNTAASLKKEFKYEELFTSTLAIAKRCTLSLQLGQVFLPNFHIPKEYSPASYLTYLAKQGLKNMGKLNEDYLSRLEFEINTIAKMGYAGYFLIVADFINWAKQHDIPVGPGRGSGAGSLVAYSLKITTIDPLEHDLLFERFLNPDRVSMPDFDIDFCINGREQVIQYVSQKYGASSVSQIITFGTLAAKAVVRDVGRVLGFPYGQVDKIAKLIPFSIGMTLTKALQEQDLKNLYNTDEGTKAIIDLSLKLEGLVRNVGKHAGGVVIAPGRISKFTAMYKESKNDFWMSQYDKDDVEKAGLIKFDLLGLKTLTVIQKAIAYIKATGADIRHEQTVTMHDKCAYDLICKADTSAVFQLESRGMKDLILRLQPDKFDDIVALVALFRPGPLQSGMVDDFINRKHGKQKITYLHPSLEPILKPTYGVILYQEQVMEIAKTVSGYTLAGADLLRRAMGKKKPEEMAKQRDIFINGAIQNSVSKKTATAIFDLIDKFSGYGFNKSHSAAYALLTYQTAWLKAKYFPMFMAAVLTEEAENTDKLASLIGEITKAGTKVLPVDINHSYADFMVENGNIRYALCAIKGMGRQVAVEIVKQRAHKAYLGLDDFIERTINSKINKKAILMLIYAGAFEKFLPVQDALEQYEALIKHYQAKLELNQLNQVSLFEQDESEACALKFKPAESISITTRIYYEKQALGFYLTVHPLSLFAKDIAGNKCIDIKTQNYDPKSFNIAGFIHSQKRIMTKKGDPLYFITLDDGNNLIDVTVFYDLYSQNKDLFTKDSIVMLECNQKTDATKVRISATKVTALADLRQRCENADLYINQASKVDAVIKILQNLKKGQCRINIKYAKIKAVFVLPTRVDLTADATYELEKILGSENVAINY